MMAAALALLHRHQQEVGFFEWQWLTIDWQTQKEAASALFLMFRHGERELWPLAGLLAFAATCLLAPVSRTLRGLLLMACGGAGIAYLLVLGFAQE